MKIIACIKQVPDSEAKVRAEAGQVSWGDAPLVINTNAMLTLTITLQSFKMIPGWCSQDFQRLRGIEFNGTDRSVDVAISKLRRKFDDNAGEARKIKTVWGKGYLFVADAWD